MVSPVHKLREFNGYKLEDPVAILGADRKPVETREIRHLGAAGFHVKGLSTCFYWHEKKITWDDVEKQK